MRLSVALVPDDKTRGEQPMTRADLIAALATSHPSISRGRVWCKQCRRSRAVDAAQCLAAGWPECCGQTMTIDAPSERIALKAKE